MSPNQLNAYKNDLLSREKRLCLGSCVLLQEVTCTVSAEAVGIEPDRVAVVFDDERAVADAGIVLPAALAGRLGIEALVAQTVSLR
jgi:hypothetical protein